MVRRQRTGRHDRAERIRRARRVGPGRARALSRRRADGRSRRSGRRSALPSRSPTSAAIRLLPGIVLGSFALGLSYNSLAAGDAARPRAGRPAGRRRPDHEGARRSIRSSNAFAIRSSSSLIAGPAGSFLAALLAVSLYFAFGARPVDVLPYDFMLWWLRDWLGVMVTAPLIFAWVYGRSTAWTWPRVGEGRRAVADAVRGIAADVRPVGRLRHPRCADRVRLLPDRRLGRPALRRARRDDDRGAGRGVRHRDRRHGHRPVLGIPGRVHAVPAVHRSSRSDRSAACCSPRSWRSATMR